MTTFVDFLKCGVLILFYFCGIQLAETTMFMKLQKQLYPEKDLSKMVAEPVTKVLAKHTFEISKLFKGEVVGRTAMGAFLQGPTEEDSLDSALKFVSKAGKIVQKKVDDEDEREQMAVEKKLVIRSTSAIDESESDGDAPVTPVKSKGKHRAPAKRRILDSDDEPSVGAKGKKRAQVLGEIDYLASPLTLTF